MDLKIREFLQKGISNFQINYVKYELDKKQ